MIKYTRGCGSQRLASLETNLFPSDTRTCKELYGKFMKLINKKTTCPEESASM
ncbi:hypothetical protein YC2023_067844 [Brassica napus]